MAKRLFTLLLLLTLIFLVKAELNIFDQNGKKGAKNTEGKVIITPEYDDLTLDEQLYKAVKNNKIGYFHLDGTVATKIEFDSSYAFADGYAVVFIANKQGLLNKDGKLILPIKYDVIDVATDQKFISLQTGGKLGFADLNGKVIVEPTYDQIPEFLGGFAPVMLNNAWGVIDDKGAVIAPPQFDLVLIMPPSYKNAVVKKEFTYYLFNLKLRKKLDYSFDETPILAENRILVKKGKLYGYIDEDGNEVIKPQFDKGESFSNGSAQVTKGGKIFKIDILGKYK